MVHNTLLILEDRELLLVLLIKELHKVSYSLRKKLLMFFVFNIDCLRVVFHQYWIDQFKILMECILGVEFESFCCCFHINRSWDIYQLLVSYLVTVYLEAFQQNGENLAQGNFQVVINIFFKVIFFLFGYLQLRFILIVL